MLLFTETASASSAIKLVNENIKRALCVYRFSAAAAASLPWELIKAEVGGLHSCGGGVGVGGALGPPAGVNTPLGVGARRETRRDLYNTR